MNENKKEYTLNYGGKEVVVETGRLAKQADGSVLVSSCGTQVLVTVCSAKKVKEGQDFFPLTVDYVEKFYSAGKFLGGFLKREGRPSAKETLNARLIDRPLRPLFPKGYMNETLVNAIVLSYNPEGDPEILAALGASAALSVSDIPFNGPLGSCKVVKIDGELKINPSHEELETADLEMIVAASEDAIMMVEGKANVLPEKEIIEAINFAHKHIKEYCALVNTMVKEVGKTKREFVSAEPNNILLEKVTASFSEDARKCLDINDKLERQNAISDLEVKVTQALEEKPLEFGLTEDSSFGKEAYGVVDKLMYDMMRGDILKSEKRIANRKLDEVRSIETEVGLLDHAHGSSLFTRGETQVLAAVTIGGSSGDQMGDRITGLTYDKFYLHYTFPSFSVGESYSKYGVSRREVGHGNLAERAITAVIPSQEDFAYTIRVSCEVLESNGSSSMASVCSGSMALMDAGVTLKAPVAGIAMGLVLEDDNYKILSDILGDEDHLGDMDFKVAGTAEGITAIQMDIKISGITEEIITKSLDQAKVGRLHILDEMSKTVKAHREEFKEGVPRIETFKISPDKIGALIGPGGKNIKAIQEEYQVTLECLEDGTVKVLGVDPERIKACIEATDIQINGPQIGDDYPAKVVTIKEYGAFVDLFPGVSGLVHVSELANERVKDVNEYVAEGDMITVKVVEIDRNGKIRLSAKAVTPLEKRAK